jgi:N-hydroxyarylamine O-acetyltransferase
MDCSSYLRRIGFVGTPRADLATLRRLHRGHLEHIPYENLDVQLGRPVTLAPADAFAKLVTARRGGWCYEMNGLFLWVLGTLGFRVMPMTGAVMRMTRGAVMVGNHLVLSVELDEPYLVDVGVGDGPIEPIPLRAGRYRQGWRSFRLERLPDGWWRLHNDTQNASAPSFDFEHRPADWGALQERCHWQRTSPDSRFVQNAICMRQEGDAILALVGRVLKRVDRNGTTERLVRSAEEYAETLAAAFGVRLPEAIGLWPAICRRHEELFGPGPRAATTTRA